MWFRKVKTLLRWCISLINFYEITFYQRKTYSHRRSLLIKRGSHVPCVGIGLSRPSICSWLEVWFLFSSIGILGGCVCIWIFLGILYSLLRFFLLLGPKAIIKDIFIMIWHCGMISFLPVRQQIWKRWMIKVCFGVELVHNKSPLSSLFFSD